MIGRLGMGELVLIWEFCKVLGRLNGLGYG